MRSKSEFILLEFEQPDEAVWEGILNFAREWNATHDSHFITEEESELSIHFPDKEHPELKALVAILTKKHEENGWIWMETTTNNYTKEQIESHDYIQIIGDGYPDDFLLNESVALSAEGVCKKCGTVHPHLRVQRTTLQVDESFLSKDIDPNDQYLPPGIDLINMPHGALLISAKLKTTLSKDESVQGYSLLDVKNQRGDVSEKLFQLKANKVILVPVDLSEKGAICPACGTVLSTLTGTFTVTADQLGRSSFFARIDSGLSSIYISQYLYKKLQSAGTRGVTPVQGVKLVRGKG